MRTPTASPASSGATSSAGSSSASSVPLPLPSDRRLRRDARTLSRSVWGVSSSLMASSFGPRSAGGWAGEVGRQRRRQVWRGDRQAGRQADAHGSMTSSLRVMRAAGRTTTRPTAATNGRDGMAAGARAGRGEGQEDGGARPGERRWAAAGAPLGQKRQQNPFLGYTSPSGDRPPRASAPAASSIALALSHQRPLFACLFSLFHSAACPTLRHQAAARVHLRQHRSTPTPLPLPPRRRHRQKQQQHRPPRRSPRMRSTTYPTMSGEPRPRTSGSRRV